jgi:hypothetical protein
VCQNPCVDSVPSDPSAATDRKRLVQHLRDLIEALDRRVPHVERAGEVTIAREASELRTLAVRRVAELEAEEGAADSSKGPTKS